MTYDDFGLDAEELEGLSEDERTAAKFRRLVELREQRDQDKAAFERSEQDYRAYESELFAEMAESPIKGSRRIDFGGDIGLVVFTPRETKFGRVADAKAAYQWFKDRHMIDGMFKPQIAKARLNELVREALERGETLPDGVDWYANRGITISKKG